MSPGLFALLLVGGWTLNVLQAVASDEEGCLDQGQLRMRGIQNGYSLLQHGGWWYDLIIAPESAFLVSRYSLDLWSWWGLGTLVLCAIGWVVMDVTMYQPAGKIRPEAHTLSFPTRIYHLVFAILTTWVNVRFYFTAVSPSPSISGLILVSIFLTPFFYFGVTKINSQWKMSTQDKIQVGFLTIGLWVLTVIKIGL